MPRCVFMDPQPSRILKGFAENIEQGKKFTIIYINKYYIYTIFTSIRLETNVSVSVCVGWVVEGGIEDIGNFSWVIE